MTAEEKDNTTDFTSVDLAHYILHTRATNPINRFANSKLHKLVYYIQGYGLGWTEQSLISDYPIAGKNGPVYMNLVKALKNQQDKFSIDPFTFPSSDKDISSHVKTIEAAIWEGYSYYNGYELMQKSMSETIYQRSLLNEGKLYTHEDMRTYFYAVNVISETKW